MYSFSCSSWELNCEELKYTFPFYKKKKENLYSFHVDTVKPTMTFQQALPAPDQKQMRLSREKIPKKLSFVEMSLCYKTTDTQANDACLTKVTSKYYLSNLLPHQQTASAEVALHRDPQPRCLQRITSLFGLSLQISANIKQKVLKH